MIGGNQIQPIEAPIAISDPEGLDVYANKVDSNIITMTHLQEIGSLKRFWQRNDDVHFYILNSNDADYRLTVYHEENQYHNTFENWSAWLTEGATDMTQADHPTMGEPLPWGGTLVRGKMHYIYEKVYNEDQCRCSVAWKIGDTIFKLDFLKKSFDITSASPFIQQIMSIDEDAAHRAVQRIADSMDAELADMPEIPIQNQ